MAHQAHNIPWNSIASGLKYIYQAPNARGQGSVPDPADRKTDIFPSEEPGSSSLREYTHFVKAFSKTLEQFIDSERQKYPLPPELRPFSENEDVLSQHTVAVIRKASIEHEIPKLTSYLNQPEKAVEVASGPDITSANMDQKEIPPRIAAAVPDWPRYIIDIESSNLNKWRGWVETRENELRGTTVATYTGRAPEHWGGYKMMSSKQERGDVITLCVYANQILPLLRLAKSPSQNLKELWYITGYSQVFNRPSGLSTVLQAALGSYIVLNLLYCKPDLYISGARERGTRDYRLCYCYRATVADCTCEDDHDYWAIPHRAFWGRGRYRLPGIDNKREQPIMKDGIEMDPLGEGHTNELRQYLHECWNWIVRSIMVGREWGQNVRVKSEILYIFERFRFLSQKDYLKISASDEFQTAFGTPRT